MGLNWAIIPDRTPLWRLFLLPGTTTHRLSPQQHPQTHLVALMVRRASAWPAARTRPAELRAGRAGKKTNLDWLRLMDSTQRPHRAPVCVTARAGSSNSRPRATDGRRPSSLPLTAMHNFRPKRTNNAPLFRSIQRCRDYHADGHDQRTPPFPTWLLLSVQDAEATDDTKSGERNLGLEDK